MHIIKIPRSFLTLTVDDAYSSAHNKKIRLQKMPVSATATLTKFRLVGKERSDENNTSMTVIHSKATNMNLVVVAVA